MTALRQRVEPIRSDKIRNAAKGEECTLNFFNVCSYDPEKTVWCHYQDATKGAGRKSHDISGMFGCYECHMYLDHGWVGKISRTVLLEHVIDAMQRSQVRLVELEVLLIAGRKDATAPKSPTTPKPRKPKAPSRPIPSQLSWVERPKVKAPAQHTATAPLSKRVGQFEDMQ